MEHVQNYIARERKYEGLVQHVILTKADFYSAADEHAVLQKQRLALPLKVLFPVGASHLQMAACYL